MTCGPTVAALLTPLAPGAIAVIGLAGQQTDAFLAAILRQPHRDLPPELPVDQPIFCRLMDGDDVLEDVVVARRIRDGGVIAEINSHGGVRIAQRTLTLLARHGADLIDGLNFHERFSACGPIRRHIDRALLRSASRRLTIWLLHQRSILPGYLGRLDRLDPGELAAFRNRSKAAIRLLAGIRVALIGPPNSGKSTLANRLIGKDRLITSTLPGTTRDWVSETALIQGWPVTLTDTAGLRRTACPIEAEAIRRGSTEARSADAVVVVLDAAVSEQERQKALGATLRLICPDQTNLLVLNKSDIAEKAALAQGPKISGGREVSDFLSVSALTGDGIPALEARLASLLGLDQLHEDLPTAILPEHLDAVPYFPS